MVKFFASYRLTGFLAAAVRDLQYDALMMLCYKEFESRVLVPLVYGRALRLSSSLVLFALIAGGTLAGILGALLALPLARRALSHSRYRKQERRSKGNHTTSRARLDGGPENKTGVLPAGAPLEIVRFKIVRPAG